MIRKVKRGGFMQTAAKNLLLLEKQQEVIERVYYRHLSEGREERHESGLQLKGWPWFLLVKEFEREELYRKGELLGFKFAVVQARESNGMN